MRPNPKHKLSLFALVALVTGSMLDTGIFSLPATFARVTGVFGAVIAWAISGIGMLSLALIFQNLSIRKPGLDSGIFSYAKVGFGEYIGFLAALGFWAGSCVGLVSYFVLLKSTLGVYYPIFGSGNTVPAIILASIVLWCFHFLILKGIKEASLFTSIATTTKVLIAIIFLFFAVGYFHPDIFTANYWGQLLPSSAHVDLKNLNEYGHSGYAAEIIKPTTDNSLFEQVRRTMLVAANVFIGIEGASVFSRYAKRRSDVGKATIIGFAIVSTLFLLVTMLAYGVLPQQSLATLQQPSMAGILAYMNLRYGALFVSVGLILAVLAAYMAWMLLAVEVLYMAAHYKIMPSFLAVENKRGVPHGSLWFTSCMIQLLLVLSLFANYAYGLALEFTSALVLIPYLFVAAFALKFAASGESYGVRDWKRKRDAVIAFIAFTYTCLVFLAWDWRYLAMSTLIYIPGTILFAISRKEQKQPIFCHYELAIFICLLAAAIVSTYVYFIMPYTG